MNIDTLFLVVALLAAIQFFILIILHIVGELKLTRQHLKTAKAKKQGRVRTYKPSLGVVIIHKQDSADVNACITSIFAISYQISKIVIIDTSPSGNAHKQVALYKKSHNVSELHCFRFTAAAGTKSQSTKIVNLLKQKITVILDSSYQLQHTNLSAGLQLFKDKNITAVIPNQQLAVNNKLYVALFSITVILANHFMRAFNGSKTHIRSNQPAVVVRTHLYTRSTVDGIIQTDINAIVHSASLRTAHRRIVRSNQLTVITNNFKKITIPKTSIVVAIIFITFIAVSIYQMSIYNALPILLAIVLMLMMFAGIATSQLGIKFADRISLILIAPFTLLAAIVKPVFSFKH